MLKGKNIILGVTGSIAAYKAAILIRLLVKHGASVKVIMTDTAKEFIAPLTLATLSKNPILVDFFNPENGDWNSHVDLGLWADAYLIAPATANTMAKMANGVADNLLLTTYLSARCPVFVAPAMDLDMFRHPANSRNIETLKSFGNYILEPATGELASGLEGKGRMDEPENIVMALDVFFQKKKAESKLAGKKILVTAGPTYEKIDPVRFIGNFSSGKMGFALAETAAGYGAEVILISGPVHMKVKNQSIHWIQVISAQEMFEAVQKNFAQSDIIILSAAVADFAPGEVKTEKIKEKSGLHLQLFPTKDIAFEMGKVKNKWQIMAGFALETNSEKKNAVEKLKKKNFDLIVLNSLRDEGAGFQYDTNKITIIDKDNKSQEFELKSKDLVAVDILHAIEDLI
jgi:phosphopantothenoylcysteine decarboxylase / phosphopantothenate---cysteine ligase